MTPENAREIENQERLAEERERLLWQEGLTKAEVEAQIVRDAVAAETERWKQKVIGWRTRHNNWNATAPSERTIRLLIELEERYPNVYPGRPASTKREM